MAKAPIGTATEISFRAISIWERSTGLAVFLELMAVCRLANGFRTNFRFDYVQSHLIVWIMMRSDEVRSVDSDGISIPFASAVIFRRVHLLNMAFSNVAFIDSSCLFLVPLPTLCLQVVQFLGRVRSKLILCKFFKRLRFGLLLYSFEQLGMLLRVDDLIQLLILGQMDYFPE